MNGWLGFGFGMKTPHAVLKREASVRRALPLECGESLQSFESLERYERMPQVEKAELDVRDIRRVGCRNSLRDYLVWPRYSRRFRSLESSPGARAVNPVGRACARA